MHHLQYIRLVDCYLKAKVLTDLFEDHAVHILSQHIKQEPVSQLGLLNDDIDAFFLDESKADEQQIGSHSGRKDDD